MTSKYTDERLAALWDRVEQLEQVVEVAGAHLELGLLNEHERISAGLALTALKAALVQTFRGALLCLRETSDSSLDQWLKEIEQTEASAAEGTSEATP